MATYLTKTDAYASSATQVIRDNSSYFAPQPSGYPQLAATSLPSGNDPTLSNQGAFYVQ